MPIHQVDQIAWSPNGKSIAIRSVEWSEAQVTPQGVQTPAVPKRNSVVVIPDVTAADPQFLTFTLPRAGKLVGFTPDGKQLLTDLREYDLVSGFHRLSFWEERPAPPVPGSPPEAPGTPRTQMILARTIDLEADQTHGYAFAADGKTFRTVYREETRSNRLGTYSKLEVRETSATTGDTLRTLLKIDGTHKAFVLSADGGRLAVVDAATDKLSVWDVVRSEKISAFDLPPEKEEDDPTAGRASPSERPMTLRFSPDGHRIVCFRAPRISVVLNADKGEPLPALEHAERLIADGGFAANGRILVASGNRMIEENRPLPKQPGGFGGLGGAGPQGGGGGGFGNGGRGGMQQTVRSFSYTSVVGFWDTATGKRLREWDRPVHVAVHPARPITAILENNGDGGMRLGIWDLPSP